MKDNMNLFSKPRGMRQHQMVELLIVTAAVCFLLLTPAQAGTYLLTDEEGGPLGRLPYLQRGDERLIPLSLIAQLASWTMETEGMNYIVHAPDLKVKIRRANPFLWVGDRPVQIRVEPEEWDGSLWLPVSNLSDIFPNCITRDLTDGSIRVRTIDRSETETAEEDPQGGSPAWELGTVIIDAGHGGKDPGAAGLFGLTEKEITLDVARRLKRQLENYGIRAVMVRDDDRFVPLSDRTHFANVMQGDLLISIHANSLRDPSANGCETYFLSPARTDRAVTAALMENSVIKYEDNASEYEAAEESFILQTMATNQYMKDSEAWASSIQEKMSEKTGLRARHVDQAGFYVLMGASMPAVLFECGFLSNMEDAKFLSSERGRQKIAESLAESVLEIKESMEASASR